MRITRQCICLTLIPVLVFATVTFAHKRLIHEEFGALAVQCAEQDNGAWLPSRFRLLLEQGHWQEDFFPPDYNTEAIIGDFTKTSLHGYNPVTNSTAGIFFLGGPSTDYAESLWAMMVDHFRAGLIESSHNPPDSENLSAYHLLGRVGHLVEDGTTHPHIHPQNVTGAEHSLFERWEQDTYRGRLAGILDCTLSPLEPTDPLPSEAFARLDSWSQQRLAAKTFVRNNAASFVEVVARITYFRTTFWGEVEFVNDTRSSSGSATQEFTRQATFGDGTVPGSTNANTLQTMFGAGNVRYINSIIDDYFEITDANGVGHTWKSNFDDEWFPCANPDAGTRRDGSVVIGGSLRNPTEEGVRVVGRFHFTRADQVTPVRFPDGTTYDSPKLADSYTTYAWQAGLRYNAGLISLANRKLHVSSSPGSTSISLSRQDNLGNKDGATGSNGFDRYFVSGETVNLVAAATDSSGQSFEAWLRNGSHVSNSRSITATVTDAATFTAVYVSDADGDGYPLPGDCNDNDYNVHPGAVELCNGVDDNCDEYTDEEGAGGCTVYYRDSDNDGYGLRGDSRCLCSPSGVYRATQAGDCNDAQTAENPGATETCNGRDDNCDGHTDEQDAIGCNTYYRDDDNDGYGVSGDTRCLCSPGGSYRATQGDDCHDGNGSIHPDATEICNDQTDNDCNQEADCADASCNNNAACVSCGDHFCDTGSGEDSCSCSDDCGLPPLSEVLGSTCTDGIDNDCDGATDEADSDCSRCGTGGCEPDIGENACNCEADCGPPPAGEDPATTCADGIDNDCDGKTDCVDPDCAAACSGACSLGSGDCCEANGSPGCEEDTCCAAVCACDPFCCENEWDADCAIRNSVIPGCDAATLCDGLCVVFHPADLVQDWAADCSCATCNDNRVDQCEALAYAKAWQRGDHDDMAGAMRALYLWLGTECYRWDSTEAIWQTRKCE